MMFSIFFFFSFLYEKAEQPNKSETNQHRDNLVQCTPIFLSPDVLETEEKNICTALTLTRRVH